MISLGDFERLKNASQVATQAQRIKSVKARDALVRKKTEQQREVLLDAVPFISRLVGSNSSMDLLRKTFKHSAIHRHQIGGEDFESGSMMSITGLESARWTDAIAENLLKTTCRILMALYTALGYSQIPEEALPCACELHKQDGRSRKRFKIGWKTVLAEKGRRSTRNDPSRQYSQQLLAKQRNILIRIGDERVRIKFVKFRFRASQKVPGFEMPSREATAVRLKEEGGFFSELFNGEAREAVCTTRPRRFVGRSMTPVMMDCVVYVVDLAINCNVKEVMTTIKLSLRKASIEHEKVGR
jgi:hypothetical protein